MEKPNTSQGEPLDNIEIYENVFTLVDDVLFQFTTREINEVEITQDLEISLNEETRIKDTSFAFQNQRKKGSYTTDIGVYLRNGRDFFCWIEAKRLPTPDGGKSRDDREYVVVSKDSGKKFKGNDGIQRFKEGKHAPNLTYSIMIGYIQDNKNADHWLLKINTWIKKLAYVSDGFWNNEDCLSKYNSNKCDKFISIHKRKDGTMITLHHYWKKL